MKFFKEEIRTRGKTVSVNAVQVDNKVVTVTGRLIKLARVKDEWYGDSVNDPESIIDLVRSNCRADIFTFVQRIPDNLPKYCYKAQPVDLAVLPIKTFAFWWENQIPRETRKNVRKSEKKGVVCRSTKFDDDLIKGITEIYNECPVRQGKPFWHYGKNFDVIKMETATYLDKSEFIGAYVGDELVGFIKLVYLEKCASTMHVISKIKHRDKAPTNALLAKAVEICEERKVPFLNYGEWINGTLGDFKRYCGFEKISVPRYYVPLNLKGALFVRLNLHLGVRAIIPERLKRPLLTLRRKWHLRKHRGQMQSG